MLMHLNFPLEHEKLSKAFLLALKNKQWAFAEGLEEVSGGSLILN